LPKCPMGRHRPAKKIGCPPTRTGGPFWLEAARTGPSRSSRAVAGRLCPGRRL
jgi:hypothetical protein